jgi:flagellar biosynthetic protein FliQ
LSRALDKNKEEENMDVGTVMDLAVRAMVIAIMVSVPILGVSIVVGLAVSIFQATTHIQEQTLTFVPKVLAILGVLILFGPWMLSVLTDFMRELFQNANSFLM